MNFESFKKLVNEKRKTGGWYDFVGEVDGRQVRLKGYKTWLQVYEVDGVRHGGLMDISVGRFQDELAVPFKSGN